MSGLISGLSGGGESGSVSGESGQAVSDYEGQIWLYDGTGQMDREVLAAVFPGAEITEASSEDEIRNAVEGAGEDGAETEQCGFAVLSPTEYRYYVKNRSFSDPVGDTFSAVMASLYRQSAFAEMGVDGTQAEAVFNTPVVSETVVLGKDSISNYLYTYLLIFVVYFMVILYGNSVAVSVAQEKSSRAMEVLVTSTSSNSLIFGKVLAGTVASFLQVGIIIGSALVSLRGQPDGLGRNAGFRVPHSGRGDHRLRGIRRAGLYPVRVLLRRFGALVSKTEDVSRSAGTAGVHIYDQLSSDHVQSAVQ